MIKFSLFSIAAALILYNWKLFTPESWYARTVGDIEDILHSQGYPLEIHHVETEDGYILTLHRIPHGRKDDNNRREKKPPVFFMHGLMCSSSSWITNGPDKSMALILADNGYDVWLGNHRGNIYSRKHVTLHPDLDKKEFYNFSFHEIGVYDLPAMIDYTLNTTGYTQLTYLGFSGGFAYFMVMGALRPEYNQKILLMNGIAPVGNQYNTTSLVFNFLYRFPKTVVILEKLGWYELFPHDVVTPFLRLLCNIRPLCQALLCQIGASREQLANRDQEFLIAVFSNFPAGTSLKFIAHSAQGMDKEIFSQFNHGTEKNLELYGTPNPPLYNLTAVTAPIILYYGDSDIFVNPDHLVNRFAKGLPNVVKTYQVPYPHFAHLDFLWGKNISLFTEETLRNINKYNNRN